tara:strand:+ start:251 stop:775 length:525 start_codon:yes stop_codon:yes gene_type:complete
MIEWIQILEVLAVVMASLGAAMFFAVFIKFILNMIPKRKATPKVQTKEQKENITMSKEAREGVTFNDIFMFMIAVPLVLLWVGFAGFVIHSGLGNAAVLENIEAYTTLIAILGGPALLIIKDALDVWKQEQAEKTAFYKSKAQSVIDYNASVLKQAQDIETKSQEQEHKMENKK